MATNSSSNGPQFQGSIPALVTPMHPDGSLDYESFRALVDWHAQEGTDALVIVGTVALPRGVRTTW